MPLIQLNLNEKQLGYVKTHSNWLWAIILLTSLRLSTSVAQSRNQVIQFLKLNPSREEFSQYELPTKIQQEIETLKVLHQQSKLSDIDLQTLNEFSELEELFAFLQAEAEKDQVKTTIFDRINFDMSLQENRAKIGNSDLTASYLLALLSNGNSVADIQNLYSEIEAEDIFQMLAYASMLAREDLGPINLREATP